MTSPSNKFVLNSHESIIESFSPKIQSNSFKEESATIISHLDLSSIGEKELSFVRSDSSSSNSSKRSSNSSKRSSNSSKRSSNSSRTHDYEAECELFIQIVTDIFEADEIGEASIYSVIGETELQGATGDESIVAVINIYNGEELCASFEYLADEKLITITEIARCSDVDTSIAGSGTHIINNMKKVYFDLKAELQTDIKMVIESDQADIHIRVGKNTHSISLTWLYLFSRGQSWYNKLGFREAHFDENSELINDFIHRPANSVFTKDDIDQLKVYHILSDDADSVQEVYARIMQRIKEITNEPSKKKVKEFTFFNEFLLRTKAFFVFETMPLEQRNLFHRKFRHIRFQDTLGLGRRPFPSFKKRWRQKNPYFSTFSTFSTFKKSHKRAKKSYSKKRLLRNNSKKYTFKKRLHQNNSQKYTFKKRLLRTKSKKNKK